MKKLQSILTAFLCMLFVSASAQTKSDLTTNRGSLTPSTGNNVPLNVNKNQMRLTLTSNDVKYYNTESISSVDINGGNITINPLSGSASDVYSGNVSRIAFAKAKEVKGKPTMIIANTIKGKGVSYMENVANWHGVAPNEEQCQIALKDLGGKE